MSADLSTRVGALALAAPGHERLGHARRAGRPRRGTRDRRRARAARDEDRDAARARGQRGAARVPRSRAACSTRSACPIPGSRRSPRRCCRQRARSAARSSSRSAASSTATTSSPAAGSRASPGIAALELNVSCPNVKSGCISIGSEPAETEAVVRLCRAATGLPLWVKLSPNVADLPAIARAAERGGADALVLTNTLRGLAIDHRTLEPLLGGVTGGLSGPALKPVALAAVLDLPSGLRPPHRGGGGDRQWVGCARVPRGRGLRRAGGERRLPRAAARPPRARGTRDPTRGTRFRAGFRGENNNTRLEVHVFPAPEPVFCPLALAPHLMGCLRSADDDDRPEDPDPGTAPIARPAHGGAAPRERCAGRAGAAEARAQGRRRVGPRGADAPARVSA